MISIIRKKWFCVSVALVFLLLGGCMAGTHMITKDSKPSITAKADKAILVIIRTTSFNAGVVIDNFLDGKMIGQTQGKVFFTAEVKPGSHYVIAKADNKDTAKIHFEAGKIYILQQGVFPSVWGATTSYIVMSVKDFQKEVQEATYVVYNTAQPGQNMPDKDYKEAKDDFEKEVKEGKHKEMLQYKGVAKLK